MVILGTVCKYESGIPINRGEMHLRMQQPKQLVIKWQLIFFLSSVVSLVGCNHKAQNYIFPESLSMEFSVKLRNRLDENLSVAVISDKTVVADYMDTKCKSCEKIPEIYHARSYSMGDLYATHRKIKHQFVKQHGNLVLKFKAATANGYMFIAATKTKASKKEIDGLCSVTIPSVKARCAGKVGHQNPTRFLASTTIWDSCQEFGRKILNEISVTFICEFSPN